MNLISKKPLSLALDSAHEEGRRKIMAFRSEVAKHPQVDLPLRHFYIEGRRASHIYAREITMKKGVAAVGYVHKYSTINIISQGELLVATEEGSKRIKAPYTWISGPGAKRALYVIEDVIWTTVHLTDELDSAKVKADLGTVTFEEYLSFCKSLENKGLVMRALSKIRSYFTLGTMADVAMVMGVVGAGSQIYNAVSGSGSTGQGGTSGYVPQAQGGADQQWQQLMMQMIGESGGQAGMLTPEMMQAYRSMVDGPMAGQYGQYADYAGGVGRNLLGSTNDLYGAGRDLWKTASDPMNALHDKLQQQTVDNSRAGTSARGIGMSPEAAGLENDATGNFNLNWQQGLLGRELQGAQGMGQLYNQAGQNTLGGLSALGTGMGFMGQQYGLPFNAANQYSGAMNQGVYGPQNAMMGNAAQYMGMGANAAQGNFANQQTNMNNMQSLFGQIPGGYGAIQRFFGGGGGGGQGYGSAGSEDPSGGITGFSPG